MSYSLSRYHVLLSQTRRRQWLVACIILALLCCSVVEMDAFLVVHHRPSFRAPSRPFFEFCSTRRRRTDEYYNDNNINNFDAADYDDDYLDGSNGDAAGVTNGDTTGGRFPKQEKERIIQPPRTARSSSSVSPPPSSAAFRRDDVPPIPQQSQDYRYMADPRQSIRESDAWKYKDDYYYDDDLYYNNDRDDYRYDLEEDDDDVETNVSIEQQPKGNFWSNPLQDIDLRTSPPESASVPRRRRSNQQQQQSPSTRNQKARAKPTTFRSGIPRAPPPIEDFYNRLFWYGVDESKEDDNTQDSSSDAEKRTMFGGTKGKFNGLDFLHQDENNVFRRPTNRRPRNRPVQPQADDYYDDQQRRPRDDNDYWVQDGAERMDGRFENTDDLDYDDPDYVVRPPNQRATGSSRRSTLPLRQPGVTPPYDPPRPMPYPPPEEEFRRSRRPPRSNGAAPGSSRKSDDWASSRVSNWFSGNNNANVDDEIDNDEKPERRRKQPKNRDFNNDDEEEEGIKWPGLGILDAFLGLDREKLDQKADNYNRRMGIGQREEIGAAAAAARRRRPADRPRRNGYGSPLRRSDDGDDVINGDVNDTGVSPIIDYDKVIDTEPRVIGDDDNDKTKMHTSKQKEQADAPAAAPPKVELSWEERALAIERVPPADVPAWGPTGDLGVDARTAAISNALEDIATARQNVVERQKKEMRLREEMTILRVDVELERKKLRQSRCDAKMIQDRIRQLDHAVEDAARTLRYAQIKVKQALEELAEVEARHWAVLSFYDTRRAEQGVTDALRELEETEPAVRRFKEKINSSASSDGTRSSQREDVLSSGDTNSV